MDKTEKKQLILNDLAKDFNCTKDSLLNDGTNFEILDSLNGTNTILIRTIFKRAFIQAGKETITILKDHYKNDNYIIDEEILKKIFSSVTLEDSCPFLVYTNNTLAEREINEDYELREIKSGNHSALQEIIDFSDPEDVDLAEIYINKPAEEIRMLYHNDTPVGYVGYRHWSKNLGDIGILISKEYRKKGLGLSAVAAITKVCMDNSIIPFYRTSDENKESRAIAIKLGFEIIWNNKKFSVKTN